MTASEQASCAGPCAENCLSSDSPPCKVNTMISPTLQMRKLSLSEVKQFSQGHAGTCGCVLSHSSACALNHQSTSLEISPWTKQSIQKRGSLQISGEKGRCPGLGFQGGAGHYLHELVLSPSCPDVQSPKRAKLAATFPNSRN